MAKEWARETGEPMEQRGAARAGMRETKKQSPSHGLEHITNHRLVVCSRAIETISISIYLYKHINI